MKKSSWLLFLYSMPARPSTRRVYVWRKLKSGGALSFQQSVFILPSNNDSKALFSELEKEVIARKGDARVSSIQFDDPKEAAEIIARFRGQSDEEYQEFLGRCRDFHAELAKERADKHFTFAELEENEVELTKLKSWLVKIKGRDFFGGKLVAKAHAELKKCVADFRRYETEVGTHQVPTGTA
jgi:hypothetical protein